MNLENEQLILVLNQLKRINIELYKLIDIIDGILRTNQSETVKDQERDCYGHPLDKVYFDKYYYNVTEDSRFSNMQMLINGDSIQGDKQDDSD